MEDIRNRIRAAVRFLKDKKSFPVGGLRLGINESGDVEVTGWSQYINFKNLTKENSLEELRGIKPLFSEMIMISPELESFIRGKVIESILCFDDYGKTSIGICSEKNGIIKWEADI